MGTESNFNKRRSLLKTLGVGSMAGLAGCSGNNSNNNNNKKSTNSGGNTSTEAKGSGIDTGDVQKGGKPVVGLSNKPRGFNPLVISDAAAWAIMDQLYIYPTARDPEKPNETAPFAFKDWEFDADSLTGSATITPGLSWTDGTDFTAEDVAFTMNYLMEQEGHRYESNVTNFKDISAKGKDRIEFSLKSEVAAVFTPETGAFAVPILPKHVWKDVDDYSKYSPDKVVGAGGFKWAKSSDGNWYELTARRDKFPDELHPGPYVDSIRFLVFGDMTALINAMKNGEVDLTYESITPNRAFQLQDRKDVKVWNAKSRGYNYVALNMRRIPFDDKPFRQSLGFAYPYKHLTQTLRKGLSTPGDYVAAAVYEPWRPDDFKSPIDHGPHQAESGELNVDKMRSFLENADGKHKYTFGSVKSSQVTGDKEIRIDGKLLTKAHTNNAGKTGEGPLKMMMTPPSTSPVAARASAEFVKNLNEVGIPTEKQPVAENSQTPLVWGKEKFDMWESSWIWMPKPHFYLGFWLTSAKADMEGKTTTPHLNPMGYTGADDLIDKVQNTYDPDKQKQAAQKALATIYDDAPVIVTEYPNRLHATTNRFDGWVKVPGGISQNPWTYLNVHKKE